MVWILLICLLAFCFDLLPVNEMNNKKLRSSFKKPFYTSNYLLFICYFSDLKYLVNDCLNRNTQTFPLIGITQETDIWLLILGFPFNLMGIILTLFSFMFNKHTQWQNALNEYLLMVMFLRQIFLGEILVLNFYL